MTIKGAPKLRKSVCLGLAVCTPLLLASCRPTIGPTSKNGTSAELTLLDSPPFRTKEPDRYQAVRTITSSTKGIEKPIVTRTTITRDGPMRREEYETANGQKLVYLELPSGRFVVFPAAKMFASIDGSPGIASPEKDSDGAVSVELLTNEKPVETRYANLGTDSVGNRSATKYRVVTRSTQTNGVSDGETMIWIDDQLGMPLRWQTSRSASNVETTTTMELSDITLDVDAHTFQVPPEYRKVDIGQLRPPIEPKPGSTVKPATK